MVLKVRGTGYCRDGAAIKMNLNFNIYIIYPTTEFFFISFSDNMCVLQEVQWLNKDFWPHLHKRTEFLEILKDI